MQRLGELNNKVIVEQKTAPDNKYVIWKDPVENKFKEFKESGWVESDQIAPAGGGSDLPYEYIQIPDIEITLEEDISQPTQSTYIKNIGDLPTGIAECFILKDKEGVIHMGTNYNPDVQPTNLDCKGYSFGPSGIGIDLYIKDADSIKRGDIFVKYYFSGVPISAGTYKFKDILVIFS